MMNMTIQNTPTRKDFTNTNNYEEWLLSVDVTEVQEHYNNNINNNSNTHYEGLFNLDGSINF